MEDYKDYLDDQEFSKKTMRSYIYAVERLIEHFEKKNIDEFTKRDIREYRDEMFEQGYKAKTINTYLVCINKCLRYILKTPEREKTPYAVKQIKVQRKKSVENVLSPQETERMIRKAKRLGMMDVYFLLKVLYMSGIRAYELRFITVDRLKDKFIQVRNKGKVRDIIIPQDLRREMRKWCESNEFTGYVFESRYGPKAKPGHVIHESTVWRKIQRIGGLTKGIRKDKLHPHSLRHAFAKNYIAVHGNVADLADILGHEDTKTTQIYTQGTREELKERVDNLQKEVRKKSHNGD
ncbi:MULTISPECIES: tyrosine-type recombinase/integrase [unclassified Breznakia]|uniref:tyrosine-type recombinase/integrase n=1 Tax=unclassified Breznakia TaxID=2623764 RepID=UPI002473DDEB|nr:MULTISPECIES: tyrosine-type recombinase/integrase [unclassified Breznakia]